MYYTQMRKKPLDETNNKPAVKTARIIVAKYYGRGTATQRLARNTGPKRGNYVRDMRSVVVGDNRIFTRHYVNESYSHQNYRPALVPGDKRFVVTNDGHVVAVTIRGRWLHNGVQPNWLVDYNVVGDCSCGSRETIDYTDMFRTKYAAMRVVFQAKEHARKQRKWLASIE